MKLVIKSLALAIAAAGLAAPVMADTATTKGGFQIKSDDGNFEAKLGGRIHFDGNFYTDEKDIKSLSSGATTDKNNSQFFFRRARITIEGRAYDYTYSSKMTLLTPPKLQPRPTKASAKCGSVAKSWATRTCVSVRPSLTVVWKS